MTIAPVGLRRHPAARPVMRVRRFVKPAGTKGVLMEHDHSDHAHQDQARAQAHSAGTSLNRLAFTATVHCLSGCATGEVLGMVIGVALGWGTGSTVALAVVLAFLFGYAFTMVPLLIAGLALGAVLKLALVADTASIVIMEVVDNAIMLVVPGAMDAGLDSGLFWASLVVALLIAGVAAFPVNRWLIARGKGHAVIHEHHRH